MSVKSIEGIQCSDFFHKAIVTGIKIGYNTHKQRFQLLRIKNERKVSEMDEERDILIFTDENGEEVEMEVVDYFTHDGQEYALLVEAGDDEAEACCCECDCGDHEHELYIMKVIVNGDEEEFVPVEEEKMDELIQVIERLYNEDEED